MSAEDDERRRREADAARKKAAQQRKASERARKVNDKGRHFHHGMAQIRGETHEAGWQRESVVPTDLGRRKHDTARGRDGHGREFTEYKNKRHITAKDLYQLAMDHEKLTKDKEGKGTWVIPVTARIDPAVQRQLEKMSREFGDRFQVIYATQAQVRQAMQVGKDLERDRNQLELFDTDKMRAQQRAKERAERVRDKINTQNAAAAALAKQQAEAELARVRAETARVAKEIEARAQELRRAGVPAEVANVVAKQLPDPHALVVEAPERGEGSTRAGREARGRGPKDARQRTPGDS